jgi:two-component system CheB/CheR fusion protein
VRAAIERFGLAHVSSRAPRTPGSLVVVVASAESWETLAVLLRSLPTATSAAIVLAFAQSEPEDAVDAVDVVTALEVVALDDRAVTLLPGRIVVVHAGQGYAVAPEAIAPGSDEHLAGLDSAAQAFGEYLTVVHLAGAHIAVHGLDAVRAADGVVLHEDPTGPRSLDPISQTDLGAGREALLHVLATFLSREDGPGLGDQRMLHVLLDEVRERSGIDFRQYKSATIMRRVSRLMGAGGFGSVGQYLRYLQSHPEGYALLTRSLLINVTEFFRDRELFEYISEKIVPDLIRHAQANGNELRLWSAGCATGEEAYSLAIIVAEALGDRLRDFHVRIFATDLDESAINFARHGVYPESALVHVSADLVNRYFAKIDHGYEVKKQLRALTVFGQHDLAQRAPFPRTDLCLCRNVLIYFTKELQQRTLQLFAFSLRTGGYLVLGKAETTNPFPEYFQPLHRAFKIYRRHGPRVLVPPALIREAAPGAHERIAGSFSREPGPDARRITAAASLLASAGSRSGVFGGGPSAPERSTPAERLGNALLDSPIGIVVIDRRYDVLAMNQAARSLLNVHGIGLGEDLLHAVSGISSDELRLAIDAAFTNEASADEHRELEIVDPVTDAVRHLAITCTPQRGDAANLESVAVVIVEVTEQVRQRREAERLVESLRSQLAELSEKNERLVMRHRGLIVANDELTAANAELRNNNEHLLLASEEAASAAEEIETLNEEMQATNEELETLNEELQATVEELNTTNDELEARSVELQELASMREEQRIGLAREREALLAALDAVTSAVAIFDADGVLTHANTRYADLAGDGHPAFLDDGRDGAVDPIGRAREGKPVDERYRVRLRDGTEQPVQVHARPFAGDGLSGVVLVVAPTPS